jgi:hypothetical protein
MVLDENAYDIVPGFLGAPIGTFSEHMMSAPRGDASKTGLPATDEDVLAKLLLETL